VITLRELYYREIIRSFRGTSTLDRLNPRKKKLIRTAPVIGDALKYSRAGLTCRSVQQTRVSYRLRFLMKSGFSKRSDSKFLRVMFGRFSAKCWKQREKELLCSLKNFFGLLWKYSRKTSQFDEQTVLWRQFSCMVNVANGRDDNLIWNRKVRKLKTVSISV